MHSEKGEMSQMKREMRREGADRKVERRISLLPLSPYARTRVRAGEEDGGIFLLLSLERARAHTQERRKKEGEEISPLSLTHARIRGGEKKRGKRREISFSSPSRVQAGTCKRGGKTRK